MFCNIDSILKQYKINVSELCREVGLSRTAFYNILSNKSVPKLDTAIEITNYLSRETGYRYSVTFLWTK